MSARFRAALFALLALTAAVAPFAAAGASLPTAVGSASADQTTATPAPPMAAGATEIVIRLEPDGDAAWTITTRVDATTEAERAAFRDLASRYESGQLAAPWVDKVRAASVAAEESTGRRMNVTEPRVSSDTNNSTISTSFTWTNFAREEGDHMVVDDAFNATRGTWLDGLTESQKLTIQLPEGYGLLSPPNGAQFTYEKRTSLHWYGPQEFEPGYMRIVYSGDADPQSPSETGDGAGPGDLIVGGFFVLSLGIIAVGVYAFSRREGGLPSPAVRDGDGPDSPSATAPSTASASDPNEQTATAGTVEPTTAEPDDDTDDVDEELLSDEERVERLLESNGGRMKQANIVKETGWSNAKVSQLLSAMADDGAINKLRIGRENLISFPDEDVTDLDQD